MIDETAGGDEKLKRELRPKFDEARLGSNPLANTLQIPSRVIVKKGVFRHDAETGQNLLDEPELEATPYTKVFITPERRLLYSSLSVRAKELWGWIQYELDSGKDYLWIPKWRYMREVSVSSLNTYKAAVAELVRYNFLCLTVVRDVYWINPDLLFHGNRLAKYPDKVKSVAQLKVKDA